MKSRHLDKCDDIIILHDYIENNAYLLNINKSIEKKVIIKEIFIGFIFGFSN